jgi:hypothetical protein
MTKLFRFLGAHPDLKKHLSDDLTLASAAELVGQRDAQNNGCPPYRPEQTQTMQILPPFKGLPSLHILAVGGRDNRPVETGERTRDPSADPISLETVILNDQSYFVVSVSGLHLLMLANPYPYAPTCVTWAVQEYHDEAACEAASSRKVY